MNTIQILDGLIQTHTAEIYLRAGQRNVYVRELQNLLNTLGFGKELNYHLYGPTGFYDNGTIQAVRNFAFRIGFPSDGRQVTEVLLRSMIDTSQRTQPGTQPGRPTHPTPPTQPQNPPQVDTSRPLQKRDEGDKLWVSDGELAVTLHKRGTGYAYWGKITIQQAVDQNRNLLQQLGITPSALNVIQSVSENEGKLDGLNNHDRAFFSYGIFQWTLGFEAGEGELPALLKKIKTTYPSTFQQLFGSYGIDIHPSTNERTGLLTLNGVTIDQKHEKEQFRTADWAYYFWRAAQQSQVQAVQVEHALSRLQDFYWSSSSRYAIGGLPLSNIITSEYGVALILDNHVNRPAYVKPCIEQAMQQTGLTQPFSWTTSEERRVLSAYLSVRETYSHGSAGPMTDARKRAESTRRYLTQGVISEERGSFRFTDTFA